MKRGPALVRWVGIISILLSLFTPLITADALALPAAPEPEVALMQESGTPEAVVTVPPAEAEPTAEPMIEPTIEPTPEPAVTPESTLAPTGEPTAEAASKPGRSEPQADMAPANAAGLVVTITPDSVAFAAGSPIGITIRVEAITGLIFNVQPSLPSVGGIKWAATSSTGECVALNLCFPDDDDDDVFEVRLTSPSTMASCGTHTVSAVAEGSGNGGGGSGTFTVVCQPNVSIAMSGPATATFGDALVQTLTVTNSGTAPASNVFVSMPLPVPLQQISWGQTGRCTGNFPAGPATCTIDSLGPNQSVIFTAIFRPTASSCGPFTFQATLSGGGTGTSNTVTTTVLCPDITIAVSGPASITPGQDLAYDITVTNAGPMQATSVQLVGNLPATGRAWSIVSQTPGAICGIDARASSLTCGSITLPAQTGSFTVRVESATLAESRYCTGFTVPAWTTWPLRKDASATTTVSCTPDIAIAMSGTDVTTPGEPVAYTIDVTNTGIGRAGDVSLESQLPEIGAPWALAPAAPAGCAIDGTLLRCTRLEVAPDDGQVAITVNGTLGTDAALCAELSTSASLTGAYTGTSNTVTTEVTCAPQMGLTTTVVAVRPASGGERPVSPGEWADRLEPGDVVVYRMVATNTGDVTLTNVTLTDTLATIGACNPATPGTLAPGSTITCDATYTVTQADLFTRGMTNVTTATSDQTSPRTASATVYPALPDPRLQLTMSAISVNGGEPVEGAVSGLVLGDVVTYGIVATNAGNVTLKNVTITETTPGVVPGTCAPATLAPGTTLRCEATYAITQKDVDRGNFINQAGVTGIAANEAIASAQANATVGVAQRFSLALDAESTITAPSEGAPLGTVTYTFTASNAGTATLADVTLTTNAAALALTCMINDEAADLSARLIPGASLECTATHVVTQPEVDAGEITVAVWAGSHRASVAENVTTTFPRTPGITIETEATNEPEGGFNRFDPVNYSIDVVNTGNVTLRNLRVTSDIGGVRVDCHIPGVAFPDIVPSLAPGEEATCSATYVIDQPDVEAGDFTQTLSVTADAPAGMDPAAISDNDVVTVATNNTPDIELAKSANLTTAWLIKDKDVHFVLWATNTGKVTLTDVTVVDDSLDGISSLSCTVNGDGVDQPMTLAPGEMYRCDATYTVTQEDVDRGSIANTASVTGKYGEIEVSDTAMATAGDPGTRDRRVEITTDASPRTGVAAGTDVSYTFTVRNTGNVTLTNLTVTDDTVENIDCGDGSNVITRMAPGSQSVTCTATHPITQAFIDAYEPADGEAGWMLTTTASVIADAPAGTASDEADVITMYGMREISIDLYKTVTQVDGEDVAVGEPVSGLRVGQEITYTLTATNTGHVTLENVQTTDSLLESLDCEDASPMTLAPGGTFACSGTLTISQEMFDTDLDRMIENMGEVTAEDPQGNPVSDANGVVVYLAVAAPALGLDVSVSPESVDAPQDVTYTLTVTNSGNISLGAISLQPHVMLDASLVDCDPDTDGTQNGIDALAIGATASCTVPYSITQAQIDAGDLDMTMQMGASPEVFERVLSNEGMVNVGIDQNPDIAVTKTVTGETADLELGTQVDYLIEVSNTGNVTLINIAVVDEGADNHTCEGWSSLAPGETVQCDAFHVITEADVIAGKFINTATAFALAPGETEITADASASVTTVPVSSSLTLEKRAVAADGDAGPIEDRSLGDTFSYRFVIQNTGNVTITEVEIRDGMLDLAGIEIPAIGDLAPGASATITVPYVVTAADVERGTVVNEAFAQGLDHAGEPVVSETSSVTVAIAQHPVLELSTDVTLPESGTGEGAVIELGFTVTNNGDVTITGITITGDLEGLDWAGETGNTRSGILAFAQIAERGIVGDLAPGESVSITASYVVTTADVETGTIELAVTATGTGPEGVEATASDTVTIAVDQPEPTPRPTEPTPTTPPATLEPTSGATPQPSGITVTGLPSTGGASEISNAIALWLMAGVSALVVAGIGIGVRRRAGQ